MSKVIGIDLGTTNSCVCVMEAQEPMVVPNDEGFRTTPSVVAFTREGDRLVGQVARRQAVANAERTITAAKRLIGRKYGDPEVEKTRKHVGYPIVQADNGDAWVRVGQKDWSPQQISAIILDKMKGVAEAFLGTRVAEAVITVPAYFNDSQRQATKDAGKIAGLDVLRIINEPTAAALAYGLHRKGREKIAVFDLGGGTFDISVLELDEGVFEVLSTNGDTFLGGEDFDTRIARWAMEEFATQTGLSLEKDAVARQRIREAAEKAKHELSSATETELQLPFIASGPNGPVHLQLELSRTRLEALCADLVDRLEEPCRKALADAKLKASDLSAVILVGGMTRMPRIQAKVAEVFGMEPERGVNPDEVVAIGAAIQGSIIRGESSDIVLLDVTPLSLGIETKGGIFEPIIHRNTTIPCKKSKVFTTAEDNQDMVRASVFQGEREMAENNKFLGVVELHGLPPAPKGLPEIEVTFEMDTNGILSVTARDKGTGKAAAARVVSNSGLTEEEISRMVSEAESYREQDHERKAVAEARNKLDNLICSTRRTMDEFRETLPSDHAMRIREALFSAEQAMESGDRRRVAESHQDLATAAHLLAEEVYKLAREESANINPHADLDDAIDDADAETGGMTGPALSIVDDEVDDE